MDSMNYITAEIDIKEEDINKEIRIINSFENLKREKGWNALKDDYKYENEKDIKNCVIKINDTPITFCYFYKFTQKGIYHLKYSFKNEFRIMNFMFNDCNYLTKIDLSHFNTQKVTDMRYFFLDVNL